MQFTALLHHIYSTDTLREAYYDLKREAAPWVDGVTWPGISIRATNLKVP
ncbi:hypothetical protein TRIP_B350376 [uncultured Desulfatiglans sp.]|uniref:Uncharacterized protein n=1 Tax=Uncultured Desulfatiglans sp. TaxID=1748965 RepID=A0A653ABQ5_UNCDX|nr:hypothetical protein TRIP_B350376 [uncultured Desulfatiglans sp.]